MALSKPSCVWWIRKYCSGIIGTRQDILPGSFTPFICIRMFIGGKMEERNERITSPEKLERYLHVIRPSMWVAFAAVFAVVAVVIVWACMTEITVTIRSTGYVMNNKLSFSVSRKQSDNIHEGQQISVGDKTATVTKISSMNEIIAEEEGTDEAESVEDNYAYSVFADVDLADGIYYVEIESKGVKPISFLFG